MLHAVIAHQRVDFGRRKRQQGRLERRPRRADAPGPQRPALPVHGDQHRVFVAEFEVSRQQPPAGCRGNRIAAHQDARVEQRRQRQHAPCRETSAGIGGDEVHDPRRGPPAQTGGHGVQMHAPVARHPRHRVAQAAHPETQLQPKLMAFDDAACRAPAALVPACGVDGNVRGALARTGPPEHEQFAAWQSRQGAGVCRRHTGRHRDARAGTQPELGHSAQPGRVCNSRGNCQGGGFDLQRSVVAHDLGGHADAQAQQRNDCRGRNSLTLFHNPRRQGFR